MGKYIKTWPFAAVKCPILITIPHSGMDYYTTNFGGTYHDQFYTQANITASYKAYISHVLNRNNTLTGVLYKVS